MINKLTLLKMKIKLENRAKLTVIKVKTGTILDLTLDI